MSKSFRNTTLEKFNDLLLEYEDFLKNDLVEYKANNLSANSWHLIDWILVDYAHINRFNKIEDLRNSLYPKCNSLKIMHDIANSSKHKDLSRPKANIRRVDTYDGDYDPRDYDSEQFDTSRLEIELEDNTILNFKDEIKKVIDFWKNYFKIELEIID
jgi:hypothetical protein